MSLHFFWASKERANIHVGETQIEESDEEKLLGITLDKKLSFKIHVKKLCKKASQKASCSCAHFNLHGARETKTVDENIRHVPV